MKHIVLGLFLTIAVPVLAMATPKLRPADLFLEASESTRAPMTIPRPAARPEGLTAEVVGIEMPLLEW